MQIVGTELTLEDPCNICGRKREKSNLALDSPRHVGTCLAFVFPLSSKGLLMNGLVNVFYRK